jgi:hypothetical protein
MLGFTNALVPTMTVGTVSSPPVTDRTTAAAVGSSQMSTSRTGRPLRRKRQRSIVQKGHPGRV